ncbi:MAG: biotin--[acetyl-CoA-carboxylase] ligase [Chloroflexota bacterium]
MSVPPTPDPLGPFLDRTVLPPCWTVRFQPVSPSTNDWARSAAQQGAPDRTVFVADFQTAGRGRQGRVWSAPPGTSLLFSVLLTRGAPAPHLFTMLGSVSTCQAIESMLGLEPRIKWPNDVMVGTKKVCGILAEATEGGAGRFVIVGIGINVNAGAEAFAELPNGSSLVLESGMRVHRGELLVTILDRMDQWLSLPPEDLHSALWQAWDQRIWRRAQQVRVREGDVELEATVIGGSPDGTLALRDAEGRLVRIVAGEILL